jgi:hypothetical protein
MEKKRRRKGMGKNATSSICLEMMFDAENKREEKSAFIIPV